jgi:integrase
MAVALLLTTGRRTVTEVTSLIWENYKRTGEKRLEVKQTKTSKKNSILTFKLGDEAVNVLNLISVDRLNNPKSMFYYPPEDKRFDYVFPSAAYGRNLGNGRKAKSLFLTDVDKTWKKVLLLAGVKRKLKHYATRHTHATQLLRATGNLKLVADTLGITIKQASKYAKTQHEDVIEGKNKAFKQKEKVVLNNIV